MRSLRYAFTAFIAFGISFFAIALVPSTALAYTVNIAEPFNRLRVFDMPDVSATEVTASDLSANYNSHYQLLTPMTVGAGTYEETGEVSGKSGKISGEYSGNSYGVGSNLTGTITMSSSSTGRLIYNPPNYTAAGSLSISSSNLKFDTSSSGSNSYTEQSGWFGLSNIAGFESTLNNPAMGIVLGYNTTVVTAGQKMRVYLPSQLVTFIYNVDNNASYSSTLSNVNVWVGTTIANMQMCTKEGSYFIAPRNGSSIVITFGSNNRAATRLTNKHSYVLYWNPTILVEYADPQISELQQTTIDNTRDTIDTIQEQTQQQTEALTDTTGSDTVTSQVVDGATDQFNSKLGFISQTADMTAQLYQALTYEGQGTVHFPGVKYAQYQIIAEQDVPITGYLPSAVEDRVRDGVTLVLFIAWLHGVHSIYARIFLGQVEVQSDDE